MGLDYTARHAVLLGLAAAIGACASPQPVAGRGGTSAAPSVPSGARVDTRIGATAGKPVAKRALPRAESGEFDLLGIVLEHGDKLELSAAQVDAVRALRAEARAGGRADAAALDSLDWTLDGRLGRWLATAWGAPPLRGRRAWKPKVTAAQLVDFERHAAGQREQARRARQAAEPLLTDEQLATLRRLERAQVDAGRR